MHRNRNRPSPERIRTIMTIALGSSALMFLGLGVYLIAVGEQPVAGAALLGAGAVEAVLAAFLPGVIAARAQQAASEGSQQ